jgi:FO synthase
VASLLAIRDLHERHGHIQEVIIQNFRAKATIPMRGWPEPGALDLLRTVAVARLLLGPSMNVQAPPNLSAEGYDQLPAAGLNDWGGISPLTPDHINPERPWPGLVELRRRTEGAGHELRERLAVYPEYTTRGRSSTSACARAWPNSWTPRASSDPTSRSGDNGSGRARRSRQRAERIRDNGRSEIMATRETTISLDWASPDTRHILGALLDGGELSVADGIRLTETQGRDLQALTLVADEMRRRQAGDVVTYVVNRNINFTNVCIKHCTFCAFSRDHREEEGYFLPMDEVVRRAIEAWEMGATEVCIQAGLPPKLDGRYYIDLAARSRRPCPRCTCTHSRPRRSSTAPPVRGCPSPSTWANSRRSGSARCPEPRPRCWTRRSGTSSRAAASRSSSGSR